MNFWSSLLVSLPNLEFIIFLSGNTQMIEVVQTAPGKFVTASGHSIKTSTAAGGVKTIIRTATGAGQVCKYFITADSN